MKSPVFLRIKMIAAAFHTWLSRHGNASRLYLNLWSVILRRLPNSPLKEHLYSSLIFVDWSVDHLHDIGARITGSSHSFRLLPHPGMLDFRALFYREFEYEPAVIRFLETHLLRIDNIVEIGANVGLYTLYFSKHLAQRGAGRVYAFEPGQRAFHALLDNLRINRAYNVSPLNAAVYDHAGLATFYEPTVAASGYRSLTRSSLIEAHARWDAKQVREYPVFAVDPSYLEPLFKSGGRVLIKIDIEGAEKQVLTALEPLLLRYQPEIVMEALMGDCAALNKIEFLLKTYRLFHLTDQGPVEHPRFIGDPRHLFNDYFLSPRSP